MAEGGPGQTSWGICSKVGPMFGGRGVRRLSPAWCFADGEWFIATVAPAPR